MKILPWLGMAMTAVCIGAHAQGAPKASSARPAAAGAAVVPDMQPGKWNLRFTRKGRTKDDEMCGDPIDGMRREVQEYAAKANAKWGCTLATNATGGRNVNIVYDCPSDRSPEGLPVQKGRWEISVVSASPQAFRIETKSTADGGYVMEGTRIGECARK